MKNSVGVTYGHTFCGLVGNSTRREYSIVGNIVNLSARLMVAAKKFEKMSVLCDESTAIGAKEHFSFAENLIVVKGKKKKKQK